MDDLIAALAIFRKYTDDKFPTGCGPDTLRVYVSPSKVSPEDTAELERLGFTADPEDNEEGDGFDCFYSYRFGSC